MSIEIKLSNLTITELHNYRYLNLCCIEKYRDLMHICNNEIEDTNSAPYRESKREELKKYQEKFNAFTKKGELLMEEIERRIGVLI